MKLTNHSLMASLLAAASLRSIRAFLPASVPTSRRSNAVKPLFLLDQLFGSNKAASSEYPIYAEESAMAPKEHGTSPAPVQKDLLWGCDYETADRICNFNRHYAEFAGYWTSTSFLKAAKDYDGETPLKFYDSVTGKHLFTAPVGRSMEAFLKESSSHGWPSFRDEEVNWEYVRCLRNGESISTTGTHLGHNIPDGTGNRYCINLVSVAGQPVDEE